MYGALDESGQRVGNSIKSSLLGNGAGLPSIERKCAADRDYLRDLDRRKALAVRIRRVVAECARRDGGGITQPEIKRRLSEVGISVVFRRNDEGRLTGATFIDHRGKTVYNGSNLGKDLSANGWWELFNAARSPELKPELSSESRPGHPSPERHVSAPDTHASAPADETWAVSLGESDAAGAPHGESDTALAAHNELHVTDDEVDRDFDHHPCLDIFRGLGRQGSTHEEIDPEFRSLHRRKKKRQRKL